MVPTLADTQALQKYRTVLYLNRIDYTIHTVEVDHANRGKTAYQTSDGRQVNIADTFPVEAQDEVERYVDELHRLDEMTRDVTAKLNALR